MPPDLQAASVGVFSPAFGVIVPTPGQSLHLQSVDDHQASLLAAMESRAKQDTASAKKKRKLLSPSVTPGAAADCSTPTPQATPRSAAKPPKSGKKVGKKQLASEKDQLKESHGLSTPAGLKASTKDAQLADKKSGAVSLRQSGPDSSLLPPPLEFGQPRSSKAQKLLSEQHANGSLFPPAQCSANSSMRRARQLEVVRCRVAEWRPSPIAAIAGSLDGSAVAVARDDGSIELWRTAAGAVGWALEKRIPGKPDAALSCLLWAPAAQQQPQADARHGDSRGRLFSAGLDGLLTEWDWRTLQAQASVDSMGGPIWSLSLAPPSAANRWHQRSAGAPQGSAGAAGAGQEEAEGEGQGAAGEGEASGAPALVAVACDDGCVRLFAPSEEAAGGLEYRQSLPRVNAKVLAVAWSPTGSPHLFAGSSDGCIRCWDVLSRRELYRITTPSPSPAPRPGAPAGPSAQQNCVWALLAASVPGLGPVLVSAGSHGSVQFWDARRGTFLSSLAAHRGQVLALAASPALPRVLFSAGVDGRVVQYQLVGGAGAEGEAEEGKGAGSQAGGAQGRKEGMAAEGGALAAGLLGLVGAEAAQWQVTGHQVAHTHDIRALAMVGVAVEEREEGEEWEEEAGGGAVVEGDERSKTGKSKKRLRQRQQQQPAAPRYSPRVQPMLLSAGNDCRLVAYAAAHFHRFAPHAVCPTPQAPPTQLAVLRSTHPACVAAATAGRAAGSGESGEAAGGPGGGAILLVQQALRLDLWWVGHPVREEEAEGAARRAAEGIVEAAPAESAQPTAQEAAAAAAGQRSSGGNGAGGGAAQQQQQQQREDAARGSRLLASVAREQARQRVLWEVRDAERALLRADAPVSAAARRKAQRRGGAVQAAGNVTGFSSSLSGGVLGTLESSGSLGLLGLAGSTGAPEEGSEGSSMALGGGPSRGLPGLGLATLSSPYPDSPMGAAAVAPGAAEGGLAGVAPSPEPQLVAQVKASGARHIVASCLSPDGTLLAFTDLTRLRLLRLSFRPGQQPGGRGGQPAAAGSLLPAWRLDSPLAPQLRPPGQPAGQWSLHKVPWNPQAAASSIPHAAVALTFSSDSRHLLAALPSGAIAVVAVPPVPAKGAAPPATVVRQLLPPQPLAPLPLSSKGAARASTPLTSPPSSSPSSAPSSAGPVPRLLASSPSARWLAAADDGGGLAVWDLREGRLHWSLPPSPSSLLTALAFLPDDCHLVTASSGNRVAVLSLAAKAETAWSRANARRLAERLQLLPDGVQGLCVPAAGASPVIIAHSSRNFCVIDTSVPIPPVDVSEASWQAAREGLLHQSPGQPSGQPEAAAARGKRRRGQEGAKGGSLPGEQEAQQQAGGGEGQQQVPAGAGAPPCPASALRMVELRHHLLALRPLSSLRQLLLVERPWRDVLGGLPAPLFRHKFGSG